MATPDPAGSPNTPSNHEHQTQLPRENRGALIQPLMSPTTGVILEDSDHLHTTSSAGVSSSLLPTFEPTMGLGRPHHPSLDIVLSSDVVYVKGVGSMAEPTLLTGSVILNLCEPTSIREVKLELKGKARLPAPQNGDSISHSLHGNYQTVVVYKHDWTFLAGEKRSAHTLKAGRHYFPFQVEIGGEVPSTLCTANTPLSVHYKFRATAIRSGLASNLHTTAPLSILRSLANDALEYQQTLEIENTWPDKIMYSLLIPHKAWAAGDTIAALVKFSPLVKGVNIESIVSSVNETTKIQQNHGKIEVSRMIASIKHEIRDNQPVVVDTYAVRPSAKSQGGMFHVSSASSLSPSNVPGSYPQHNGSQISSGSNTPYLEDSLSRFSTRNSSFSDGFSNSSQLHTSPYPSQPVISEPTLGESDLVALIPITIPSTATASHTVAPIDISYRIRWVVNVVNPDGHHSELRCSLPIMILDNSLLTESRLATNETRRLCFGLACDSGPVTDIELPTYSNHVLDRVANSFFPSDAVRVSNIWSTQGFNSPLFREHPHPVDSETSSGIGASTDGLEWVNNELMMSLGESWRNTHYNHRSRSEPNSTRSSRSASRASSPERCSSHTHTHTPTSETSSLLHPYSNSSASKKSFPLHLSLRPLTPFSRSKTCPSSNGTVTPPAEPVAPVPLCTTTGQRIMSAFTQVPDYEIASRGFLGGGIPPLESIRGLPSYEDSL